jgi:hypothetical protein
VISLLHTSGEQVFERPKVSSHSTSMTRSNFDLHMEAVIDAQLCSNHLNNSGSLLGFAG